MEKREDTSGRMHRRSGGNSRTSHRSRSETPRSNPRRKRHRAEAPRLLAKRNGIRSQMPPLHPFQRQIVARLQRKMQMRHQTFLVREARSSDRRRLRPDRSTTAAAVRVPAHASKPGARAVRALRHREVAAIRRDIDARQHDFGISILDKPPDLRDNLTGRHRSRRPAPKGMMQNVQR